MYALLKTHHSSMFNPGLTEFVSCKKGFQSNQVSSSTLTRFIGLDGKQTTRNVILTGSNT